MGFGPSARSGRTGRGGTTSGPLTYRLRLFVPAPVVRNGTESGDPKHEALNHGAMKSDCPGRQLRAAR